MSDLSNVRRRGVWTVVTPFGEVRTFHELSALREAMAKEHDEGASAQSGPDSDPAPISGRDIVVLAAPVAEASTIPQPAGSASLPPMRPRLRSIPPPLPTHPFKLSPSLQPPSPDQAGREPSAAVSIAPAAEQESAFPLGHRPAAQQPFAVAPSMQPPTLGPAVRSTANGAVTAEDASPPVAEARGGEASGVASPEEVTKRTLRPRVVRRNSEPVDSSAYVRAASSRSVMVGGVVGLASVLLVGMYVLMNERSEDASSRPVVGLAARTPPPDEPTGARPPAAPTAPADTSGALAAPSGSPAASTTAPPPGVSASALPVVSPSAAPTVPSSAVASTPLTATQTPTVAAVAPAGAPAAAGEPTPTAASGAPLSAAATRRSRDLAHAEAKYRTLLASNPSDVESLAALGDTLRGLGNHTEALTMYKRALSFSPAYQPALLGVADTLWEAGDHDGARKHYAEVVDRFPAEAVPARARERSTP